MNPSAASEASPRWQEKFALLEKVYGSTDINLLTTAIAMSPNAVSAKNGGQKLTFGENLKLICWPAFFFGFLWYFFQGMWKKALVILAFSLLLGTLIDLLPGNAGGYAVVGIGYGIFVGRMATIDYYRKLKSGFNEWF